MLDASYWSSGDKWDSSWKRSEQTQGYHSEVTALQVDGDRANPAKQDSPRSTDPIGRAGRLFLDALRDADTEGEVADDVTFSVGTAVSTTTLAEVKSQPLKVLIPYMLLVSDNTLAEMLARITSKQGASNGSAASLQQVIPSALLDYGIPPTGLTIRDGSGLSDLNAVPPSTVVKLLIAMNNGGQYLDVMKAGLPIAGQSGTLAGRFTGDNAVARGHVWAKTGWIDTVVLARRPRAGRRRHGVRVRLLRDRRRHPDRMPAPPSTPSRRVSSTAATTFRTTDLSDREPNTWCARSSSSTCRTTSPRAVRSG